MANIKSAKKRILVTAVRTERNKANRSKIKTCIKNVEAAVQSGDKAASLEAFKIAESQIAKAGNNGLFHKSNASRKISRLAKMVNGLA